MNMTNMNYGHLTLFDDALNEWLQKMNNYCEMRAAYTQWDGIIFKIAMVRNFVIYGIIYQIAGPLIVMNYLKKRKFVKI